MSEKTLKLIDNDRLIIFFEKCNPELFQCKNLCKIPFKFSPGIPLVDNKG